MRTPRFVILEDFSVHAKAAWRSSSGLHGNHDNHGTDPLCSLGMNTEVPQDDKPRGPAQAVGHWGGGTLWCLCIQTMHTFDLVFSEDKAHGVVMEALSTLPLLWTDYYLM